VSTFVATPEPLNVPPRILLELDMSDLTPDPPRVSITRLDPDGRTRSVRLAEPAILVAGVWLGYDYESPFGVEVSYEATSATPVGDVVTDGVILDVTVPWLRHPGIPTLSIELSFDKFRKDSFTQRSRATSRAVFTPLGRSTPVVVASGYRATVSTEMTLRTDSIEELDAMWAILDDETVLLLDIPLARGWGVTHEYVSIGDVTETRIADWGSHTGRWFSLPYLVVDRPAGGFLAQFTYADVLGGYGTYTAVYSSFASYADLLANRPRSFTTGGYGGGTYGDGGYGL
jgi:hypothetical protein